MFFISQKKGFDALNATQKKTLRSLITTVSKKIKKNNLQKRVIFKNNVFLAVFLNFFRNGTLKRDEVFCIAFSASKPFY